MFYRSNNTIYVVCPRCWQGKRRPQYNCTLCHGSGRVNAARAEWWERTWGFLNDEAKRAGRRIACGFVAAQVAKQVAKQTAKKVVVKEGGKQIGKEVGKRVGFILAKQGLKAPLNFVPALNVAMWAWTAYDVYKLYKSYKPTKA